MTITADFTSIAAQALPHESVYAVPENYAQKGANLATGLAKYVTDGVDYLGKYTLGNELRAAPVQLLLDPKESKTNSHFVAQGIWGAINRLVLGGARLLGQGAGWLVGVPSSLLGMAVGIKPAHWIAGAQYKGGQTAYVIVGALVGISEVVRAKVATLLFTVNSGVGEGFRLLGESAGGVLDIFTDFPRREQYAAI